jgi:hypothetical protein
MAANHAWEPLPATQIMEAFHRNIQTPLVQTHAHFGAIDNVLPNWQH